MTEFQCRYNFTISFLTAGDKDGVLFSVANHIVPMTTATFGFARLSAVAKPSSSPKTTKPLPKTICLYSIFRPLTTSSSVLQLDELRVSKQTLSASRLHYEQKNIMQHVDFTTYSDEYYENGTPVTKFTP